MNNNKTKEHSSSEKDGIIEIIKKRKLFYLIFGLAMSFILSPIFLVIHFQVGFIVSVIVALYGFGASLYCANIEDYITYGKSRITPFKLMLLCLGGFIGTYAVVYWIDKIHFLRKLTLGIDI